MTPRHPFLRPLALFSVCAGGFLASCERHDPVATSDTTQQSEPTGVNATTSLENAPVAITLPETIGFNEHIQPILSEKCYQCHGPDSATREPEKLPLRLDRAEDALAERDGEPPVILPGDSENSLLMKLIRSGDEDLIMPPPGSHMTMTESQIALIGRWIDEGAVYEAHWAYLPIKPAEPPTEGSEWSDQPLDRFVFAKMAAAGLKPNPDEEPARFHRRLSFDLTGLPPSPESTKSFVAAHQLDADAAVGAEADRLLATTESAEHLARQWLDAARYADTHGIHIDNYRGIWPYRDWVIDAFQQNMPFDQFTREQVAGDMLPAATIDQKIASGFNRCLATTGEGGAIAEEYTAIYASDQADTIGAIYLGMTASCASCHDHKFDPLSTREFYSLTAFFRNTTMSALDGNRADHPPSMTVVRRSDREELATATAALATAEAERDQRRESARAGFEVWQAAAELAEAPILAEVPAVHLSLIADEANAASFSGPLGAAIDLSGHPSEFGDLGQLDRQSAITYGGYVRIPAGGNGALIARMDPANGFRGWDIYAVNGRIGGHLITQWSDQANKFISNEPLAPDVWHHLMITFDGAKQKNDLSAVYVDGGKIPITLEAGTIGDDLSTSVPLTVGSRHNRDSLVSPGSSLQDFRIYNRVLAAAEISTLAEHSRIRDILAISPADRNPEQAEILFSYYLRHHDPETSEIVARIEASRETTNRLNAGGSTTLVMEEKADQEPFAHVLVRGVYSDLGERVIADTPAYLPPMPESAPHNRLGLADWLVSQDQPLTPRVTVNRAWHHLFGIGIVETTEDFGIMGAHPSHPLLLDSLAADFRDHGWDYRRMLRTMVVSKTYRQSPEVREEAREMDPQNRLLSRGPRNRLDAEEIRDLALSASDLLSREVGGPPVKPYQPEGIWEAVAMKESNTRNYQVDQGKALYRRSLYTFWKRTAPPATMEIFNAPSRERFCVRREVTNTPLQALALLNDPQFVEASRVLAENAIQSTDTFEARLEFISSRLLDRTFDDDERAAVNELFEKALAYYQSNPEPAKALIATGRSPLVPEVDAQELAAYTLVCSQILNLDETITH